MEDDLRHVQQALKGLYQQLSCLAKGMTHLKREEETIFEQSSRRDFGGHPMHDTQWGYGNISPQARSYEHDFYYCYKGNRFGSRNEYNDTSCKRVPRNDVRNGGNYVNLDERFRKRKGDCERHYESYNYGEYDLRSSSQTLGTTSRPLSCNKLKLPLLYGTFYPYEYENRRRMRAQPIKTWSLMKQSLRNKFGVENHERQRQGQAKEKFIESSMGEMSTKANKVSQCS
ncbi:hypothetical protein M9H77_02433 [Catharanthus roseus]|uniref:Uncharacterized protein n=1 Tax=Catharanthus roseus TaxID=4058 RepID=A0ACC0C8W9_CATRO|nr:hypothetical protein M9H77_02433 [Catharanthus roseus]